MKPPPGSRRGRVVVLKLVTKSYFTTHEPFASVCVGKSCRETVMVLALLALLTAVVSYKLLHRA